MYAVDRIGMSRRGCMRNQGALRPPACVAAGEGGASVHVRAGVPLGDAYVALPVEGHAEPLQVVDAQLGTLDGPLHHARVAESVALLQRVRGVLVPAVCDVHGGQGRVDATGGDRGVRVDRGSLPDGEDVDASLGKLDRGSQTGAAGADDEHGAGEAVSEGGHACFVRRRAEMALTCYDRREGRSVTTPSRGGAPQGGR